jgi:hypothetical protein
MNHRDTKVAEDSLNLWVPSVSVVQPFVVSSDHWFG